MNTHQNKPFIIAVAGGSGSGKTTVSKNILKSMDAQHVAYIAHDDYYKDQSHLPLTERTKTNYDHPHAFDTELLISHLQTLSTGKSIQKPKYDFTNHTRAQEVELIHPAEVIIVEGILIFESVKLRELFNLKIFVDTDADIRLIRRIRRDMAERGRTFESVVEQYISTVRPMHLEFVEPNKRYADIFIPEGGNNEVALKLLYARVREIVSEYKVPK